MAVAATEQYMRQTSMKTNFIELEATIYNDREAASDGLRRSFTTLTTRRTCKYMARLR